MLPEPKDLVIGFAHAAYRLEAEFARRGTGIRTFAVHDREALAERVGEADVLVVSGLWQNGFIESAPRLRFIQSISAGIEQYSPEKLGAAGIRLASAQGVNAAPVAEHAMALVLALRRRLHEARDNQRDRQWRRMLGDPLRREDELGGKTMLIVGLGGIGGRLADLACAFGMRVVGLKREAPAGAADLRRFAELKDVLPEADVVAVTCALTPETTRIIDAEALSRMKPTALLVNVARGRCVDEAALIAALAEGRIGGAGLDVFEQEPLPEASPLWDLPNVLITPHSAGETRRYEERVVDLLVGNLDRLRRGERLVNEIV